MSYLFHRPGIFFLFLLMIVVGNVHADDKSGDPQGISFHVLRVIYSESDKKGVTLTAYNTSSQTYLMQSLIRPVDPLTGNVDLEQTHSLMPFIVTPPLARLEANGELILRIRRNAEELPADRESVFFISMKAIPAQLPLNQTQPAAKIALTVVSSIKVFFRPAELAKSAIKNVADQVRFRREGNVLIAQNSTPYWLTFSRLKVGAMSVDKEQLRLMVPPKSQQSYILPKASNDTVSWQLIDEDGWDTPWQQQPL